MDIVANEDPLQRFVDAQEYVYQDVVEELSAGRKTSHWMWFVFPQIAGLGTSSMARKFAITSLDEAREYLTHPILGARLQECCELVNRVEGRTVDEIFGSPDNMKFRSSMTLFARATGADGGVFRRALEKYFQGSEDPATLAYLGL